MKTISSEIKINAPMNQVWQVLTDFENWTSWNPIVKSASGRAGLNETLMVGMMGKDPKSDGPKYSPVIIEFEEGKRLRWKATMMAGFIFTNYKVLELSEENGVTTLVHKEEFSGLMVSLMWNKLCNGVPKMLEMMNNALKTKVEGN